MKDENRKYDYVIGIDLGHGETSAAICSLDWDTPVEQLDAAKDLEMGGNMKVIPSAITLLPNGDAKIGDSAFNPDVLKQAQVNVCFKQKPKDVNGQAEQLMTRFMKEVYQRIRSNNSGMLSDNNHLVYIATPSGWDKHAQDLYVQMAKNAGIPIPDNGVTKESRAAFVRAQSDSTSGIGRNIAKGAIVFDMGSSTLDFTYMNKDLPKLIDNGYDCGASHVEKIIFADAESENEEIRDFEKKYPDLRDYLLFEARKVKEQVYFDPTLKVKKTVNFDDIIDDEDFEDARYRLSFKPGDLDNLLDERGYLKEIKEAMIDYKKNFIPGYDIYGVFMTGGASRMDFVKSLITECWGVPNEMIYRDQDPSLTISQGVAEVARMDLRTSGMDVSLSDDIANLKNSSAIYNSFVNNFGEAIYTTIVDNVKALFDEFAHSSENLCVLDLQTAIKNNVSQIMDDASKCCKDFMESAIAESTQPISEKVENIIKHYTQQGMNINFNVADVSVPSMNDINLDSVINEISTRIDEESGSWGEFIGAAAIGFAIGYLLGPVGWIGIAAYQIFKHKPTEEEKRQQAMITELNPEQRNKVYHEIMEKWDSLTKRIHNSIFKALTSDKSLERNINNATIKLLDSYKENLIKARLLIE